MHGGEGLVRKKEHSQAVINVQQYDLQQKCNLTLAAAKLEIPQLHVKKKGKCFV